MLGLPESRGYPTSRQDRTAPNLLVYSWLQASVRSSTGQWWAEANAVAFAVRGLKFKDRMSIAAPGGGAAPRFRQESRRGGLIPRMVGHRIRWIVSLNATLLGLSIVGYAELYREWLVAEARFARLEVRPVVLPAPKLLAPAGRAVVDPSDYQPAIDRLLFARDRNPSVEVVANEGGPEGHPLKLPILIGFAVLDDRGPRFLIAASSDDRPKWIDLGGNVGGFVIEGISGQSIVLQSEEGIVVVPLKALRNQSPPVMRSTRQEDREALRPWVSSPGEAGGSGRFLDTGHNASQRIGGSYRIGAELQPGYYAADPEDVSPDGTAYERSDGSTYRKVVRHTPFGSQSWWEKLPQ